MNSLINYVFNNYANELTKPTSLLRLCLAIYLEDIRYDSILRHDHVGREVVSSLGSSGFLRASGEQLFHPGVTS